MGLWDQSRTASEVRWSPGEGALWGGCSRGAWGNVARDGVNLLSASQTQDNETGQRDRQEKGDITSPRGDFSEARLVQVDVAEQMAKVVF